MKFVHYQDCKSPHQIPLARELLARLGIDNFRYVYRDADQAGRAAMGWNMGAKDEPWQLHIGSHLEEARRLIEDADVLLTGMRDIGLFERRARRGLITAFQSERWFKPAVGFWRMVSPGYRRMACRFARLMKESDKLLFLPMGIHSARDMARLHGFLCGDLRCLFHAPELEFERTPGGHIWIRGEPRNIPTTKKYALGRMRMWGYFVEKGDGVRRNGIACLNGQDQLLHCQTLSPLHSSTSPLLHSPTPPLLHSSTPPLPHSSTLRVLWVGRLLDLKRVDTIIHAVGELSRSRFPVPSSLISLDIYGSGPEENQLKKAASRLGSIVRFHQTVPIAKVRKLMREHDVYVLSSNGYEGWGAVASEALEEGMVVLGSREAGATATMLPEDRLFDAGDATALTELLERAAAGEFIPTGIGTWSASNAAVGLLKLVGC